MTPRSIPTIAITPGDPEGIGAEVTAKALKDRRVRALRARFLIIGNQKACTRAMKLDTVSSENLRALTHSSAKALLLPAPLPSNARLHIGGYQSGWSIEAAARLSLEGFVDGMVTGPISKEHLQAGGFPYNGHTDFLAALCGSTGVTMMLANAKARASLVTVHVPLREVPGAVTEAAITRAVTQTLDWLREAQGVKKPKIAVTGLNPHAGENGILGSEEERVIAPALEKLRAKIGKAATLLGPIPGDTAFLQPSRYDAVVAMYHDQGLGPIKALDFRGTVNLTLGLPIVRTSVDHGTAFDIAGKGVADAGSMVAAILQCHAWTLKRKRRA